MDNAYRKAKSSASISCVVLGKDPPIDSPSFTISSSHEEATPLYRPLLALPFPAAIPATWVP